MTVRRLVSVSFVAISVAAFGACGDERNSESPHTSSGASSAALARERTTPAAPRALAEHLGAVDAALRRAIDDWRAGGGPQGPAPHAVTLRAVYVQRALRRLARRPGLEAAAIRRLPPRLAHETRDVTAALRDLARLSAGWPAHRVVTGPPDPLRKLLRYYRGAQRRFGVRWQVLAAVNLVESAFGRVRIPSVAGAQGPMQFMPATWRAYGLGGDVNDPHDAILGAANLLRHAGAPADYASALHAYNPSSAYVDAVRRYAALIARDDDALYLLYCWRP